MGRVLLYRWCRKVVLCHKIVGTIHEFYPEPENLGVLDIYISHLPQAKWVEKDWRN